MLMSVMLRLGRSLMLVWLLLCWIMPAHAVDEAAQVILSKGEVKAMGQDGTERSLARRDKVLVGDVLKTGADGMVQIRFIDKALLTLRENSEFRIESYRPPTDSGGNVLMHLVEGGFRTITGSIGKGSADSYEVKTAAASIGIRGTHYEVMQEAGGALVMAVWEGGIRVSNESGGLELGRNANFSYSRVEKGKPPEGLLTPPAVFQPPAAATNKPTQDSGRKPSAPGSETENPTAEKAQQPPASLNGVAPQRPGPSGTGNMPSGRDNPRGNLPPPAPAPIGTMAPLGAVNFTETNPVLQEQLTAPTTSTTSPTTTTPTTTTPTTTTPDPWTTAAASDPRLVVAEFDQLQDPARDLAVLVSGGTEIFLATIVSPSTPVFFDYSSNGPVSFELRFSIHDGTSTPPETTVLVNMDKQHSDFNSLVMDIQEDLTLGGSLVGVRESTATPGRLEFYTVNNDPDLIFYLTGFNFAASTATPSEVQASIGGIAEGSFANGRSEPGVMQGLVVFGQDDRPSAFLMKDQMTTTPNTTNPTAGLGVGRQGDAVLQDYNPSVGGRTNISWGRWAASATNPIHIYKDISTPNTVSQFESDSAYWLTAEAASATSLTGARSFQMGTSPTFLGSGSDGAVTAMSGSFDVDFTTGSVTNGALSVNTANQSWNTMFSGGYADSHASMSVDSGFISGTGTCSNCVNGQINGIFVAPGDRFAGGFNMHKAGQPTVNVQGLFLMDGQ